LGILPKSAASQSRLLGQDAQATLAFKFDGALAAALIAVARKVIVLDVKELDALKLFPFFRCRELWKKLSAFRMGYRYTARRSANNLRVRRSVQQARGSFSAGR
jgi:hypothetical protein